jgi:hypothetical protein
VLAALARDAERRDDFDTIRSRDLDFMNRAAGFPARLQCTLLNLTQRKSPWEESLGEAIRRHTVSNALLRAELAMQLFNREKGYCPSNLEELVPEYLPAVPIDAYSGDALKCQATADGLLIYSVGRDGIDDGGRLTNTATYWSSKAGYDYDVDTLTRK